MVWEMDGYGYGFFRMLNESATQQVTDIARRRGATPRLW